MADFFKEINPDGPEFGPPRLAENYWPIHPMDLYPDDIAYPRTSMFLIRDATSNALYINGDHSFDSESFKPTKYSAGRVGLMRVYQPDEAGVIDAFIVDIRPINRGTIDAVTFTTYSKDDIVHSTQAIIENAKWHNKNPIAVRAYIYRDMNGNNAFRGDERLVDAARRLAEAVDQLVEGKPIPVAEEGIALRGIEKAVDAEEHHHPNETDEGGDQAEHHHTTGD
jgi:hypothetical protein